MKIFIDSADINEIKSLNDTGLIDGVTTNPSLIAKSGLNFIDAIEQICKIVDGPVSAEVTATDADTMILEGKKIIQNCIKCCNKSSTNSGWLESM